MTTEMSRRAHRKISRVERKQIKTVSNRFELRPRGFWSEVQQVYENRICTSLPSSLRIAWNGVLKPRHFLGVRLAVRTMKTVLGESCIIIKSDGFAQGGIDPAEHGEHDRYGLSGGFSDQSRGERHT